MLLFLAQRSQVPDCSPCNGWREGLYDMRYRWGCWGTIRHIGILPVQCRLLYIYSMMQKASFQPYTYLSQKVFRLVLTGCLRGSLFEFEDWGSTHSRNVDELPHCTALHLRRYCFVLSIALGAIREVPAGWIGAEILMSVHECRVASKLMLVFVCPEWHMYIRNSMGPRKHPLGTPDKIWCDVWWNFQRSYIRKIF
jgi:hypothetical protein